MIYSSIWYSTAQKKLYEALLQTKITAILDALSNNPHVNKNPTYATCIDFILPHLQASRVRGLQRQDKQIFNDINCHEEEL